MVVSEMNNTYELQGFSTVTENELLEVDGGWVVDVFLAFGFVCMCIYVILDTLYN